MTKPKVSNQIVELKGYVFDCTGYRQAEDYRKAKLAVESYVLMEFQHGPDIRHTIKEMTKFQIPEVDREGKTDDQIKANYVLWERIKKRVNDGENRQNVLDKNMKKTYMVMWDMCTKDIQTQLCMTESKKHCKASWRRDLALKFSRGPLWHLNNLLLM